MNAIERSIQRARTRLFFQRSLFNLGRLALAGLTVAAALLLTQRVLGWPGAIQWVWGWPVIWWAYAGIGLAVLLAAPLWAWLRRPSIPAAAALVDQRLELKDRLATALYARQLSDDPFAVEVVRDAERAASGLALARAFPVRPTAIWAWALTAAVVLAALALFLPDDLLKLRESRQQAALARAQVREQDRKELLNVIQVVREIKPAGDPQTEPGKAQELKDLMEMAEKNLGDPSVRREVLTRIEAVRDQLVQKIDQQRQDLSALQNTMSQLNPPPGPADQFAAALQRGDYGAAARALEDLAKDADKLPADQREALRQQLVAMANQLGQMAMNQGGMNQPGQQNSPTGGNPSQTQPAQQSASNQNQNSQTTQPSQQMASGSQSNPQTQPSQGGSQQQTANGSQQRQPGQQNQSSQQCQNGAQNLSQALQKMSQGMGQQSQNTNGNPNQNPSGNQTQQGAQQGSQQLQQLARMQQQMQQMRSQQSQLNQSMGQMAQNCNGGGRQSSFSPNMFQPNMGKNSPERNNGTGGPKAGTGEGGNPLGRERHMTGYNTDAHSQATDGEGRVIASWMENGPMAKNASVVEFNKSITQARQEAEKAITEDRLPRQYQKAVHDYFNQMPQSPEEIQKPSTPAAPR